MILHHQVFLGLEGSIRMISKKYVYDYDDYDEDGKDASTMGMEIVNDEVLPGLEEIIIGCWGECYDNGVQPIIDAIVDNKDKFQHIKSLFIGDMDYEECEVSWIEQGDYSKLLEALPLLERLTIKGSTGLSLGEVNHSNLISLEIICGGLPQTILQQIGSAKLPKLTKLNLYIGVDNYGFDGSIEDIMAVINNPSFGELTYLGIGDSDIQDDIVKAVVAHDIVEQLEVLEFSNGTLTDIGGGILLEQKDKLKGLTLLDLHYHFLSDEMMAELRKEFKGINLEDQHEVDTKYGDYPMLTE